MGFVQQIHVDPKGRNKGEKKNEGESASQKREKTKKTKKATCAIAFNDPRGEKAERVAVARSLMQSSAFTRSHMQSHLLMDHVPKSQQTREPNARARAGASAREVRKRRHEERR